MSDYVRWICRSWERVGIVLVLLAVATMTIYALLFR